MSYRHEVRYQVLGPVRVESNGQELTLGGHKQRLLLALLIGADGHALSSGRLVDGLWGEEPPGSARKTLQVYVHRLRTQLGDAVRTEGTAYSLDTNGDVDAIRFGQLRQEAKELLDVEPRRASELLSEALGLWNGPAYADLEDEPALAPEVARLEELRVAVLGDRIDADLAMGAHVELIGELEGLTHEYPMQERFRAQHMTALYRSGRHVEALRSFEHMRRYLADEIGVEPSAELSDLERRILARDESLLLDATEVETRTTAVRGYELRELVASGTCGDVYRAYQRSVGRQVAVRVIGSDRADDPEFIAAFLADTERVAALEHPHVGFVYDTWREPGRAFQVTRWLGGGSLADAIMQKSLNPASALRVLDTIGSALGYAHRQGVVHGRVRATKVLFDDSGAPYLCDFSVGESSTTATEADDRCAFYSLARELLEGQDLPEGTASVFEAAADADSTYGDSLYGRIEDFLRALRQAAGLDVVSPTEGTQTGVTQPGFTELRNPYKGLRAFQEADAEDFHGREDLVAMLAERIDADRLVAVVGPSGSGKSSVVKAGLAPRLRKSVDGDLRLITEMFPGAFPFEELEGALLRVGVNRSSVVEDLLSDKRGLMRVLKQIVPSDRSEVILVIDQFEELFTLVTDEATRALFLDSLLTAVADPHSQLRVVLTLRADFYDRPLQYPEFGALVRDGLVTVTALGEQELHDAIEKPARSVGLDLEPGLASRIVRDVIEQPGGLPLMQYALTELVEDRDSDLLTLASYEAGGGVVGALGRRAEGLYSGLRLPGQHAIRQALLRMVNVDEGSDDLRRRVRRVDLSLTDVDESALNEALQTYGGHRLLTFDQDPVTRGPTVEVAHEALLREWDRLRGWVDEQREDLVIRKRLDAALTEWQQSGEDSSFLLTGGRLEQAEAWSAASPMALTTSEAEFLAESRAAGDRSAARRARGRRRVLAALSLAAIIAVGLAAVAWIQRGVADRRSTEATVQRLATASLSAIDEDPDLSILLAIEAYEESRSLGGDVPGEVMAALQTSVQSSRLLARFKGSGLDGVLSPDGRTIAFTSDPAGEGGEEGFVVMDVDSGIERARLTIENAFTVKNVAFSPDGAMLAASIAPGTAGRTTQVVVYETNGYREVASLTGECCVRDSQFSHDGRYLAVTDELGGDAFRGFRVWDLEDPAGDPRFFSDRFLDWMPGSATIVVKAVDDPTMLRFRDVVTGDEAFPPLDIGAEIGEVDVHPEGDRLLVSSENGAEVWEPGGAGPIEQLEHPAPLGVGGAAYTGDGRRIALWGADDEVQITSIAEGATIALRGHRPGVWTLTTSQDGQRLAAVSLELADISVENEVLVWDLSPDGPAELGNLPTAGNIWAIEFTDDGSTALVTGAEPDTTRAHLFDLTAGTGLAKSEVPPDAIPAISPNERDITIQGARDCGEAVSIDDQSRWLLLSRCDEEGTTGQIVDLTADESLVIPEGVGLADFGPSGTVSEGLVAYQIEGPTGWFWITIRDVRSDRLVGSFDGTGIDPWRPFFSLDGRLLTFGSGNGGAFAIDMEEVLSGTRMVDAVVLRPRIEGGPTTFTVAGGEHLVTGHSGESLRFWDLETGELWLSLPVDTGDSTMIAFTPDDRYLYYEARGGVLKRFPLDPDELVALARSRVQRDFSKDECERLLIDSDCSAYAT